MAKNLQLTYQQPYQPISSHTSSQMSQKSILKKSPKNFKEIEDYVEEQIKKAQIKEQDQNQSKNIDQQNIFSIKKKNNNKVLNNKNLLKSALLKQEKNVKSNNTQTVNIISSETNYNFANQNNNNNNNNNNINNNNFNQNKTEISPLPSEIDSKPGTPDIGNSINNNYTNKRKRKKNVAIQNQSDFMQNSQILNTSKSPKQNCIQDNISETDSIISNSSVKSILKQRQHVQYQSSQFRKQNSVKKPEIIGTPKKVNFNNEVTIIDINNGQKQNKEINKEQGKKYTKNRYDLRNSVEFEEI
ncbi:hypothetical protein PPERSA_06156 [Pseudocohnilembus persalinus]|uniref:Uncharacterized protein n=1 Tax=Pseudocohnilembus persalinus TaxID=266149 RepID=A0A0V0QE88_PSEPJ|nr:hypothetical protein PPERSA_06156 [Pseudocohnilembus persalinus]|eukprot:KRX00513.1 hypothetical protein PPERSA_06156 [Pseudocohnilembus persalinus]